MNDRYFILNYSNKFERCLNELDDNTKHLIRKNNKLSDLYDLFLDFIIDSNKHLDLIDAKEATKELTK
ncbi:hypothetical protein EBR43_04715 [bacterium]|nr:hypothetical protein [bacterium]